LHVLTDDRPGRDVLTVADAALAGGAPCLQVRLERGTDRERFELTRILVERGRAAGAVVLVNDRVDLALATGADGVHLGAEDLPVAVARRVLGPHRLIGGTAREPATARRLVAEGADYLGVGPVHATRTKDGLPGPLGSAGLHAVTAAVDVPVVAIAGITAERVAPALAAGAYGVAVVAAVSGAADPRTATVELLERISEGAA
jgi:thiamine-phosphate pyrophosphorylase